MNKNLFLKLLILVVVISAFISYDTYARWKNTHFAVNPKTFHIDQNYQSLVNNQKKISSRVSLAYQFHLMKSVDQSVTLPNLKRKITIHKIWYAQPFIYILYSVNLHKSDQSPSDVPKIDFSNIVFHSTTKKTMKTNIVKSNAFNHKPYPSEVYQNELYRSVLLQPVTNNGNSTQLQNIMAHLSKIELKGGTLVVSGKQPKPLDQLSTLSYPYHANDSVLFQKKLNKTLKLNNGVNLNFTKWKATLNNNELYLTTNHPNDLPDSLYLKSNFYDQFTKRNQAYFQSLHNVTIYKTTKGNAYMLPLFPMLASSHQLKLSFYKTEKYGKGIKFKISSTTKAGDKIGKAYGSNFYYDGVSSMSPIDDKLTIKWDNPTMKNAKPANHLGMITAITKPNFLNLKSHMIHEIVFKNDYSILSVSNEKGEHPKNLGVSGSTSEGKYGKLSIIVNHQFVQNAKTLVVSFDRLPYTTKIKEQHLTINIPNKGYKGN